MNRIMEVDDGNLRKSKKNI